MEPYPFILKTLEEAGALLLKLRDESFEASTKHDDPQNIVTSVDLAVNDFITKQVQEAFPDHAIHSEEADRTEQKSAFLWCIDPIDGSANFSRGIPHYAVCLGVLENNVPIAGGVYNPVTRELFSFERGKGAFCNGKPIRVSEVTELKSATVFLTVGRKQDQWEWGTSGYRKLLEAGNKTRNFGSSALDVCFVASGRIDACVYGTFSTLDIAPVVGLLTEAGGMLVDESGTPVPISASPLKVYAVNNPELYEELRTVL